MKGKRLKGLDLKKSIKRLESMQKASLVSITSAYKTASTNCLMALTGELPTLRLGGWLPKGN